MDKSKNDRILEMRMKIWNGDRKFQFGSDRTAINIIKIEEAADWVESIVVFTDGYQNYDRSRTFRLSLNDFAIYLVENNARIHWTVNA